MTILQLCMRFAAYGWRRRGGIAACLLAAFLSPLLGVWLLWTTKELIDRVLVGGRIDLLAGCLGAYAAVLLAKIVLSFVDRQVDARVTEQIETDVRGDLFGHLIRLPPGALPKTGPGEVISHLSGDVGRVEYLVFSGPIGVITNIATAGAFFLFLVSISWKLTLLALAVSPLLLISSVKSARKIRRLARTARRVRARWTSEAEERFGATPMIQVFAAEAHEEARFRRRCRWAQEAELRGVAFQARLSALNSMASGAGGVAMIALGAYEVHMGALTVGALVAFLGSVGSLQGPVESLSRAWGRFHKAAAGAERVAALLDTPNPVADRPGMKRLDRIQGAVEFSGVSFAYPGRAPVLEDVSFRVEPGETVALVGASGAGKTTLIKLLLRQMDPTAGAVRLDGCDIRDLTRETRARAICASFQEPYVLRGSVRETIGYAGDHSEAEIEALARAAHATGFIEQIPGGLLAAVGPRGSWLSGGQRQRLSLARALSRDCPVLVLDEATAAVDSETEDLIQGALARIHGRRTLILIGHRLSSIRNADRIVLLENGRVAETGSPETLLARDSRFRELFSAQLRAQPELAA